MRLRRWSAGVWGSLRRGPVREPCSQAAPEAVLLSPSVPGSPSRPPVCTCSVCIRRSLHGASQLRPYKGKYAMPGSSVGCRLRGHTSPCALPRVPRGVPQAPQEAARC